MQRKTVRRVSKVLLTWLVVFMLTLDTASASHSFRYWVGRCNVAQPVYCGPTVVECCPVPCCPTVSPCEAVVSDCCEDASADIGEAVESTHESMRPLTEPAPPTEVTPADQPPALSPTDDIPDAPSLPPELSTAPAETDNQLAPADSIDIMDADQEGPTSESSPNDLDTLPDTLPGDALTEPADESGDLFAEPAMEEPADQQQPADELGDLFAEPATEEPAMEAPATQGQPTDDGLGDLFGEPATEEPAAQEQPADDLGDLFGDPADPGTSDAGGATTPDATGTDSFDDLFGDPAGAGADAETDSVPTPSEPATNSLDDLFGDPSAETTQPAADDFDNIYGATPDGPSASGVADDTGDLLGNQPSDQPESQSEESSPDTDLDDLFGQVAPSAARSITAGATLVRHAVGLAATAMAQAAPQTPMRTWTDNTGTFHTTARLVAVGDDYVRLLKDNGRFTTVPIRRLSQDNLSYVQQNAQGLSGQPVVQVAGR